MDWDESKHPRKKNGEFREKGAAEENAYLRDDKKRNAVRHIYGDSPQVVKAKGGRLPQTALTKQEWAQWYSAIADIKLGYYVPKCKSGHLIQIANKVIVTRGTFEKPKPAYCFVFQSTESADLFISLKKEN